MIEQYEYNVIWVKTYWMFRIIIRNMCNIEIKTKYFISSISNGKSVAMLNDARSHDLFVVERISWRIYQFRF